MRNSLITALFCIYSLSVFSQQKGVSPLPPANHQLSSTNTYAVVVGISDYQDKDISDLQYADKDAEAFANYLRSPAGGSLDGDHLHLLINEQATAGRIAEALDDLIEKAKKDDQVIIYFSGHGDVEGKKLTKPGFLLCWDAPSRVYMGGGTYSLSFLQEVVSTLSVQNQAKVVVITDACHAGKLAGSQIGGAQLTTANLAKQYANEVKILSCQPNEFSLEGPQWGGGRGVFSYHLVDGLFGLADRNNDGQITLGEIDRYLEDHVTGEASPQSQVPILLGNKTDRMASVNANILADLKKNKTRDIPVFASTDSRGFEDEILSRTDTSIQILYKAFKQAVAQKRFLSPENDCAEKYYVQLQQVEMLTPLKGIMKRNYAAALQDDAQKAINDYLRSDVKELRRRWNYDQNYKAFPKYLARSAELLGAEHYLYINLRAKQYYFEGLLQRLEGEKKQQPTFFQTAKSLQYQTLAIDSSAAYAWNELGLIEMRFDNYSNAVPLFEKSLACSPNWLMPFINLCKAYTELRQYGLAEKAGYKAVSIDSSSALAHYNLGNSMYFQSNFNGAQYHYLQALQYEPDYPKELVFNLGLTKFRLKDFAGAEAMWLNYAARDSLDWEVYLNLGEAVQKMGKKENAGRYFQTAIAMAPSKTAPLLSYACFLYLGNKTDEAIGYVEKAIGKGATMEQLGKDEDLAPLREQKEQWDALMKKYFAAQIYYNLACEQSLKGDLDKAFESLELSLTNGWKDYDWMQQDTYLANLREQANRWKTLMKKYFPDKFKD